MSDFDVALIVTLALIKIPLAAWLLWLPFRADRAGETWAVEPEPPGGDEDGGGGGGGSAPTRPPHRRPPRPRRARRGPHRGGAPASPARVRATAGRALRRHVSV